MKKTGMGVVVVVVAAVVLLMVILAKRGVRSGAATSPSQERVFTADSVDDGGAVVGEE